MGSFGLWVERVVLPVLFAVVRVVAVFSRLCVCFSSVSLFFSPLCSCVDQVLFGGIKIVFVTYFFLMKNVLRHYREKK